MVKVNLWAFVGALVCVGLFWIAGFSGWNPPITKLVGINLWYVEWFGSPITFIFGLLGFAGGYNLLARIRSIATLVVTCGLSVFSTLVILMGNTIQQM